LTESLVTGGAGFIGLHLFSELLRVGHKVTICDNLFRGKMLDGELLQALGKGVKMINADLTRMEEWGKLESDFDYVFHLAAINGTRFFYEIPQEVMRVNLLTLINLMEWSAKTKPEKILYTSSSEVYTGAVETGLALFPTSEKTPTVFHDPSNPRFSYAVSKFAGEVFLEHYSHASEIPYSIVRYHNVYGPRMGYEHVIPELCTRLSKDTDSLEVYGAENRRCFCYIDDAVKATILTMESDSTNGEIVNVGNDLEEIKIVDLAQLIAHIWEASPMIVAKDAPRGSVSRRVPDISKLRHLTGFEPSVRLEEGLKKTVKWYRAHPM